MPAMCGHMSAVNILYANVSQLYVHMSAKKYVPCPLGLHENFSEEYVHMSAKNTFRWVIQEYVHMSANKYVHKSANSMCTCPLTKCTKVVQVYVQVSQEIRVHVS
jgi:hypothetical protein